MGIGLYNWLTIAYVAATVGLILLTLLVSSFYRRRLKQPAPIATFVLALVLAIGFIWGFAFLKESWQGVVRTLQAYILFGCGISYMAGTLSLYFTMKKRHK